MKKERLHITTLVIGGLLAFAIIFSQYLAPELTTPEKVKTEQTQEEGDDQGASFIALPSFSLPAPVHVEHNLNPYCLFEIFLPENVDEEHEDRDLSIPDRFFETMFRVIISPNAP